MNNYKFYRVTADNGKRVFFTFEEASNWIKENKPKSWEIETKEVKNTGWYSILEKSDVE